MADFNPFAGLDKSRFPKSENSDKDRRNTPRVRLSRPAAAPVDTEDEEALFLNAVGSVRPLGSPEAPEDSTEQSMAEALFKDENPVPRKPRKGALSTLNHVRVPEKSTATEKPGTSGTPGVSTTPPRAESAPDFASLVNLTLPSAADDKRPALFREQPQSRRESARARSRDAVSVARDSGIARRDTDLARLASPDADDPDLFLDAMRAVAPLSHKGRDINPDAPVSPTIVIPEGNPLQDFMDGKLAFALASTDEYVEGHVVGLDLMLVSKLQNGQFSPEAHLDLHGLNAVQAFQALVGFFRAAYLKGQRTVLVVPGRGKNSHLGMGVLREKIQEWFTQEPFRRVILAFCTARSVDGGTGALYVLLRKFKKTNGKVHWDRRPVDPDLVV